MLSKRYLWIIMVPLLKAVPTFGQNRALKKVTVADFAKWSNIVDENISTDGKWALYKLNYDYGADTLFVRRIKDRKKIVLPDASNYSFSKNGKFFASIVNDDKLKVFDLVNDKEGSYFDVADYEFTENALVILCKDNEEQTLIVLDLESGNEKVFEHCIEYSISKNGKIAISMKGALQYYYNNKTNDLPFDTADGKTNYKKLTWNEDSNALCFLEQIIDENGLLSYKVLHYNLESHKITCLKPFESNELKGQIIIGEGNSALKFSSDGSQIFFYYSEPKVKEANQPFEIWDTDTPYEYGWNKSYGDPKRLNKIACWVPTENKVVLVGTNTRPNTMITINRKYAVCYDLKQYEPQYEQVAPADMYLKNTVSGEEQLLFTKQTTAPGITGVSPKGNYLHYFRDNNWWLFDIRKKIHINLTAKLLSADINAKSPGWSSDEKYFIFYDNYDIWLIKIADLSAIKITDGKESQVRYRLCEDLLPIMRKPDKNEYLVRSINFSKGLILSAVAENGESGYFLWHLNKPLIKLVYGNSRISRIKKADKTNDYIYLEETATDPPKLMYFKNTGSSKVIYQSNLFAKNYLWGKAELIEYKNNDGLSLKGILYKPAGYVPEKKYPMIVYIYEEQSGSFHNYIVPTEYDSVGFNAANYFLDDYMVLFPDIVYTIGNPGVSALYCVNAAVDKVKSLGILDENRIGLIGHSFGGYESSFIITQTNLFVAAVCGSGVMNSIAGYFSYSPPSRRPDAWRYESEQFRMGFSPFDNWNAYLKNSALYNAANCETPLLSWAGKKDTNVLWTQGSEFHLALRRLGKKNVFILYENEGHTIKDRKMQKDLSVKIKNWFDFYLKKKAFQND